MHTLQLPNAKLPQIGFGLWKIREPHVFDAAINAAIEAGYRHFDTAQIYGNEALLGAALANADLSRDELFVTTKIWRDNFEREDLYESFNRSLEALRSDFVDLLLLHYPVDESRNAAWEILGEIAQSGRAKNIGVSNFTVAHLKEIEEKTSVRPAVNQVELHLFLQEPQLRSYCREKGIVVQAYSPLAHGRAFGDETIKAIANKHGKSQAQIMIRWAVEQGLCVLVKSETPSRIQENLDVYGFSFDDEDKQRILKLDRGFRVGWGPSDDE